MKDMKNQSMLITVVAVVIVGAAAFFGGMKYQQSKQFAGFRMGAAGMMGQQGNRQFVAGQNGRTGTANSMRPVVGEILSMDDKSITVKLQDGSSKIVLLPDTATYSKTDTGSKADLKVGGKVGVFGTTNSDGSVTAQTVQENPAFGIAGPGMMREVITSPSPATK